MELVNIVCVYWGSKYKPEYVQNLYNMVERHLTIPFNFICFTDHVNLHDLVKGNITFKKFHRHEMEGWWNKLQLFSDKSELKGVNLYFDLDVVILKNIDCFATWGDDLTFGIIRDFGQPKMLYNSSIMKWNNANATKLIWDKYFADRPRWRKVQGDQNVITELMQNQKSILKPFPDDWSQSYKWLDRTQTRFHKSKWTFEQDPKAKIAVFHGQPNPHESDQKWVKDNWK